MITAIVYTIFVIAVAVWCLLPTSDKPVDNSPEARRLRYEEAVQREIERERRRVLEALERRQEGGVQ